MLVTITVASIILTQVIPSMRTMLQQKQLKNVVDRLADDLRYAQSESIKRSSVAASVSFTTDGGTQWCYGISTSATCDCTLVDPDEVNACALDISGERKLKVGRSVPDENIQMGAANFAATTTTTFDPVRGMATPGRAVFSSPLGIDVRVNVSALGRISVCVEDERKLLGYDSC